VAADLKSFIGRPVVEALADDVTRVHPRFERAAFVADALRGLASKELLARGIHVADALRRHLPADYEEAVGILVRSLGPELDASELEGQGMAPFRYLPHVAFVRDHGAGHFDASMRANHALTRRFTAEWSIRPFLEREPARAFALLGAWARDPSVHVRRLVSEGTRPRLPWAPQVRALRDDPRPGLALLELLRDDPEGYVRRSVANHLNDVAKDHPDLVVETCARWLEDASPERRALVRHALRTLVKRGHPGALGLLGHGERPRIEVLSAAVTPARVRIGGKAAFRATIASKARRPQSLAVDLEVHFVKKSGAARPKVMKGRTLRLGPGGAATIAKTISFALHSTRTPNPGPHAVDLLVNGVRYPGARFSVHPARGKPPAPRRGRALPSRRAR
jgi:3-methyladenine DNA glycosylase AlkC